MNTQREYISTSELSRKTGLPTAWLKRQGELGELPAIHAGRRLMFHAQRTAEALANRTAAPTTEGQR